MRLWKKALSLTLSALMLVAMFPASILTANALNYEGSEFLIGNLTDWNEIAESEENFVGKTVKLTQNLDAGGEALPTLFGEFGGTFDGQGYSISNFSNDTALIAETTLSGAVIKNLTVNGTVENTDQTVLATALLVAHHDSTEEGSLTISDVTVEGSVTGASQHVGAVLGVLTLRQGQSATLQNIKIGATVTNNRTDLTHACISAGGVVGIYEPLGGPVLTVKNVKMSGSVSGEKTSAGGILGSVFTADREIDLCTGGEITVSECEITGTVSSAVENTVQGVGGIVGTFGGFKRDYGDFTAFGGTLNVEHCVIGGEISNTNGLDQLTSVGGILGSMSYHHATVNVEHCLITASFASHSLSATDGTGAALILGTGAFDQLARLNVNNTVTTHGAFQLVGAVIAKAETGVVQLILNGKNCSSAAVSYELGHWRHSGAVTDRSVLTVSEEAANAMVRKDQNGFITKVGGQITVLGVQDNVNHSESYTVRLILLTYAEAVSQGKMYITLRNSATGESSNHWQDAARRETLSVYGSDGTLRTTYRPQDFGGKSFITILANRLSGDQEYTFEITPEYTTANGVTVTGDKISITYGVGGQYLKEKESHEKTVMPTVRVMSSNILIADAKGYNLDNIHNATGEVYDPSMDGGAYDQVIYKDGLNYHWYFRDDVNGEYFGREDGQPGFSNEERMKYMSEMLCAYSADFIGLQEVFGGIKINAVETLNMQKTVLSYLGEKNYAYVDFSAQVPTYEHYTPILYRTDRWRVVATDIADEHMVEYGNGMHRWQWALFESLENPDWKFIVLNLHGPNNLAGVELKDFQPTFFSRVNYTLRQLERKYPGVSIAVTGDFNQQKTSEMLTKMTKNTSLVNTVNQTENCEVTPSGIDYIFATTQYATVAQTGVVDNKILRKSSDHWAIYADFQLKRTD